MKPSRQVKLFISAEAETNYGEKGRKVEISKLLGSFSSIAMPTPYCSRSTKLEEPLVMKVFLPVFPVLEKCWISPTLRA